MYSLKKETPCTGVCFHMIARPLRESDSPSARVKRLVYLVIDGGATHKQTSVCLGGSMSCPTCSHKTKVIGTEKNKRVFYCEGGANS